ncbi:MAG: DNA translocase FtsK [Bacteroidetes bacterium]|nr:DNA translocase FtsK [Bacteroidota bacterium]
MAKSANSKNTQLRKKSSTPAAKSESKRQFSFVTDGRLRKIVGLLSIFIALFLAISFISYFTTWKDDQDKVFNAGSAFSFLFQKHENILNHGGRLGAYISHQIIYNGFGICALLFVIVFSVWGINRLMPQRLFSGLRTFFYTTLFILMLSPVIAYILPASKHNFPFGGAMGEKVIEYLKEFTGEIGTLSIIVAMGLIAVIMFFNPIFSLSFWGNLFHTRTADDKILPDDTAVHTELNDVIELDSLHEKEIIPVVLKEEVIDIPETFWEINNAPVEEMAIEPIQPEKPIASKPNKPNNEPDLTLEVTKIEEKVKIVSDAHISVGTDEPYDPSLELRNYKYPTLDLLDQHSTDEISIDKNELEQNKNQIINTLKSFGISIAKISATVGPTVTLYEIVPAEGVRISKIRNLEDDIALSLSALGIRIIAPIPGKGTIGIEVPNLKKQIVSMRTLISSDKFINNNYSLPIALGKKIDNENYIVDLATMPHLLMAGATGQGKSVGINAILVSLLYKKHPSQVKFVMVDPKKVELSIYKVIEKHFLAKLPNEEEAIITDTKKVINTLNALCIEMDNRYDLLKEAGVRNIKEYNDKFIKRRLNPNKGHQYLPFIVLVVDEFADLIMTAGKEVEMPIARLAQLARAVGIHLIIATQRPSVNVITGTIKANFPGRIAFRVSAKVDSRTILDTGGADQLIGRGDMLILHGNDLVRVQCAFVDTPEVERIVDFIGSQQGYPSAFDLPEYEGSEGMDISSGGSAKSLKEVDQMFEQCARLVVSSGSGSTSMLQRRFNLGYNRAGRIMDQLEAAGIVGASVGGKPRELMVHTEVELDGILEVISRR